MADRRKDRAGRRTGRLPSFLVEEHIEDEEDQQEGLDRDHIPTLTFSIMGTLLRSIEANEAFAMAVRHLGEHALAEFAVEDRDRFGPDEMLQIGMGFAGWYFGQWVREQVL